MVSKMIDENYLKELLVERANIVKYAVDNFELLKKRSDDAIVQRFGTRCDGIGQFYPGVIMYNRDKGKKKGKLLKEKTEDLNYTIYESDCNNDPLRIRKYNKFGCESNYYYQKEDVWYCVPFLKDTNSIYGSVYKYSFENGKLVEFAEINKDLVIVEQYDYRYLTEGFYECTWYYYYNSEFNLDFQIAFEFATASLNEKLKNKLKTPSDSVIRKHVYYYKIVVNDNKIKTIKEYQVNNNERQFIRNIYGK